jgi:hypothetical protein
MKNIMNNWRKFSEQTLDEMANPFYGILMDPEQVSKELATPEGAQKVAALIEDIRQKGWLGPIREYSTKYGVPLEFLLGVVIDEQMRAFGGKPQLQKSDLGDNILAYLDPAGTSVGASQIEPNTFYHLIVTQNFRPKRLKDDLLRELLIHSDLTGWVGTTAQYSPLTRELAHEISSVLRADPLLAIECVAKILSYHRDEWARVKGLEDWTKTYDAWEVYAYGFSRGMEGETGVRRGMVDPEARVARGLPRSPGASARGRGIGQIATIARDKLKDI